MASTEMAHREVSSLRDAAPARPYAPGCLHLLLIGLDRLPGPAPVWYAAIGLAATLIYLLEFWTGGTTKVGEVDADSAFWGVVVFAELWLSARIERVASDALDSTRPALRMADAELERLRYELTVAPAVPSVIALLLAGALMAAQLVAGQGSRFVGVPAPVVVGALLVGFTVFAILFTGLLQLLRQMRLIRTTLDQFAIVDPFLPGPLSGFSRLTSMVGIAIVLLVTVSFFIVPPPVETEAFVLGSLPFVVVAPAIALLAFVVPLYGLHTRLAAEKDRLQAEAEHRLKALLAALNDDVDRRDLTRAEGLNQQLTSMLQQREVLTKLPTWPWSAGTFRALVSAVLLPLFLLVVQLVLSRVI